jgi:hypothetical protein
MGVAVAVLVLVSLSWHGDDTWAEKCMYRDGASVAYCWPQKARFCRSVRAGSRAQSGGAAHIPT